MPKAQTEVLPADRPLLPFLLLGTRGTVWYQTPVGLERNGGRVWGGSGKLFPFLSVLRQDVRVLPRLCSRSLPEHLCIKSL